MEPARYQKLEQAVQHLQVADIVLVRHRRGALYKYIREASESYWNHMALVFAVFEGLGPVRRDVLIVEALDKGIEVHRLQSYARDPEAYDIGVKRMEGLTDAERDRIRGYFLDVLDTPYDFTRLFVFLVKNAIARLGGNRALDYVKRKVINIDNFVCSSFAQRAFYLALPPDKRDRALFREGSDLNFLDQMEAITPGDIAQSKNTVWLYNPHD